LLDNLAFVLHNFLFRKGYAHVDEKLYRRVLIVGTMILMALIIIPIISLFDVVAGFYDNLIIYASIFGVILVLLYTLINQHFTFTIHAFLLITNLITFGFAAREGFSTGVFMFFIPLILAGFVFFDFRQMDKSIGYAIFSFILFTVAIFFDIGWFGKAQFEKDYIISNFFLNGLLSMACSMVMMIFLNQANYKFESNLLANEQNLQKITDELRKSKQRYELAIRGANAGIWEWDIENQRFYASPKWLAMLNYAESDLPYITIETFYSLIHFDDVSEVKKMLDRHLTNRTPYHIEYRIRTKTGQYIWVEDAGLAIWNEAGIAIRMVGSISNINYRRSQEEKIITQNKMLEKANQELDRFVYATSHDLRSPLMSVLGLVNIAMLETTPAEVNHCLVMIRDRIKNLDEFIKEIIHFSRNARVEVVREPVVPSELVSSILDNLNFMEGMNKIKLDNCIQKDLIYSTDKNRMRIILSNLLSNAIKYHDLEKNAPFIRIDMKRLNGKMLLSIADNGEGIPEENREKVFDMFYRASEKSEGSGLGLYIVKEMVEKLDGEIKLYSTIHEGTEFQITLPA